MRKIILDKYFLLLVVIIIGGFLRFFKLSEFPVQLNHDEISQIYDVKSIVQTGRDIYGKFLPLAFYSTGDYKPGHYIYVTVPFFFILGDQEITIRVPAAFFGTLNILAVFFFIYTLTKNKTIALLSAGLVAISPSEIFYSRKSFESVIGENLLLWGLTLMLLSFEKVPSKFLKIGGAILLGLSMYIYTAYTIIVPLIILLLVAVFRRFTPLIYLIFFIAPLIFFSITHSEIRFRAASVFVTQDVNLGRLISLGEPPAKAFADHVFTRYLNQFDLTFLFLNGLDLTNEGHVDMGPIFLWQLPFLFLGVIYLIRKNNFSHSPRLLFGLLILSMIPSALTFEGHSPHRAIFAFTILNIICAFGVYWLTQFKRKIIISTFLMGFILLNFIYFVRMYTVSYPYEKSQHISYPFKEIARFAWERYNNFDQIIIDPKFGETNPMIGVGVHYYLAFYGNYPPVKLQKQLKLDNLKGEIAFDKFSIRPFFWPDDKKLKNTLIIASPWSLPMESVDKNKIIQTFYFYSGKEAYYAVSL